MNKVISEFIEEKKIAVVGVSRTGKKFGNIIVKELAARGFEVYIIHPTVKSINGLQCYPDMESVKGIVSAVVIVVPPTNALTVIAEAANAGITKVWLQQGSASPEVLSYAKELNLTCVSGKCILMYAGKVSGIHAFHRGINQLFRRY